jgi:pimeloyl-ACP methyl ester carboxylesterase
VPLTLLHGESNPTTPLGQLDCFRELCPGARIVTVAGEGLTLAASRPDLNASVASAARGG